MTHSRPAYPFSLRARIHILIIGLETKDQLDLSSRSDGDAGGKSVEISGCVVESIRNIVSGDTRTVKRSIELQW